MVEHITLNSKTNSNTRLIFLEINGVLIPQNRFAEKKTQLSTPEDYLKFDVDCLHRFENILRRYPDVLVVVFSSWQNMVSSEVVRFFFSSDIKNRILGFTPSLEIDDLQDFEHIRYKEVWKFLNQNNALNIPWLAVDNICLYPPDVNIVVTNAYLGFDELAALALDSYLQELK